MKQVPLSVLESKIIRPGFEAHLRPLLAYRGAVTLGRAHRLWNLIVSAMEHEASTADITQRLQVGLDFSHLCGPEKVVQNLGLRSFASRLKDNPKVMAEMPNLAEYVHWAFPRSFELTPISAVSHRSRNVGAGGWREFVSRRRVAKPRPQKPKAEPRPSIVYPFLIHDGGRPEHTLLKRVNAAVPHYFDPETRADICQDLIVGILCGDFSEDDLKLPVKEMTKRVQKMFPTKYGPISLDSIIPGTDDLRLIDTLSTEDSIWERI